ncbi:MAG: hypothetical protein LBF27_05675 [Sphingobacterium sp.]|jgi:hypothetical protein|nr:hypothetical protein [Sphingobacterium sp.]
MKYIANFLCVFIALSLISSCKAQNAKLLINGNVNVGNITYSVRNPQNKSLILVDRKDISRLKRNLAVENPRKDFIPKSELKLNVSDLKKIKNEVLGSNTSVILRFYFNADEKLLGLGYELNKKDSITNEQFKKFDQEIRKTVKGSLARSFDYSTYLPWVIRPVVLKPME